MSHDDPKSTVAHGYNAVAEEYAGLEATEWPRMRRLRQVLDQLAPGSHVLDLGCGSAEPAGVEIIKKHRLTGVDISTTQVALAREKVPEGNFLEADMGTLSFEAATFDAVVSFYAFDQVPRDEWLSLLERIREWLRPGGLLLFSAEDADVPGTTADWLGVPMFFSSFPSERVGALVRQAGFVLIRSEVENQLEHGWSAVAEVPYTWILALKT